MDGPGHDRECADNDNETYIFAGGMLNPSRTVEGEEVIAAGGRGQERTQFLVMPFPMLLQDERKIAIVMSKIANGARSAGGGCTIAAAIGVGYLSARLFSVKKKREPSVPGQSAGWDRR